MPDLSMLLQMMKDNHFDFSNMTEDGTQIDFDTMMRLTQIMSAMNSSQNNASTNLLYAMKPFLRDSKKQKIDQYAQLLKFSSVMQEINKSGGDFH